MVRCRVVRAHDAEADELHIPADPNRSGDSILTDGDTIRVGQVTLRALATPATGPSAALEQCEMATVDHFVRDHFARPELSVERRLPEVAGR